MAIIVWWFYRGRYRKKTGAGASVFRIGIPSAVPRAMRSGAVRFVPTYPLCIVKTEVFDKLEFGGESPLTIRARCSTLRSCPPARYRYCGRVRPIGICKPKLNDSCHFVLLCNFNEADVYKHLYDIATSTINIFCHSRGVSID